MRYHLTPNGPKRCIAKKGNCKYSGQLHGSIEEVKKAYEKQHEHMSLTSVKKSDNENIINNDNNVNFGIASVESNRKFESAVIDKISVDKDLLEESRRQEKVLQEVIIQGRDFTDEEIASRADYVERVTSILRSEGLETHKLMFDEDGNPSSERREVMESVIEQSLALYSDIPKEKKSILTGGIGGAGKGTILRGKGLDKTYATINPDDTKELMAVNGFIPNVPGLTAMESSTLAHREAVIYSTAVYETLISQGKNINIDATMGNIASVKKDVKNLTGAGYDIRGIFVDIDNDTSIVRGNGRYKKSMDSFAKNGGVGIGGRPVPRIVNKPPENPVFSSSSVENFAKVHGAGLFSQAEVWNNDGAKPVQVDVDDFVGDTFRGKAWEW